MMAILPYTFEPTRTVHVKDSTDNSDMEEHESSVLKIHCGVLVCSVFCKLPSVSVPHCYPLYRPLKSTLFHRP